MEGKLHHPARILRLILAFFAVTAGFAAVRADGPLITPGATLVTVYSAARYFEGPSWDVAGNQLYFTQLTTEMRILRLTPPSTVSVWMDNTQAINGTYLANDGRLLGAQGDTRSITSYRIGPNGPEDPIVLAHNSAWKAPNDLCQTPAGDIYFTAPDFDTRTSGRVYRIAPSGTVTTAVADMPVPNGIITSIAGDRLYVSDSELRLWRSYPILADGSVGSGSLFFNPTTSNMTEPDGMTVDELGNLYFCGRGGVWIVSPAGVQLGMVPVPQFNSNVTFGGVDGRTLYITCDQRVYSLAMEVRGAKWSGIPDNNQPPQVNAGADRAICLPRRTVHLTGSATDDGLPNPPGAVALAWSLVSGPAQPTLSTPNQSQSDVTLPAVGTYVLRLTASDGFRTAIDDVRITLAGPADFDLDTDVDADDVALFAACLTGPNAGGAVGNCELMDLDVDGDVDNSDFGLVQRCLSGAFTTVDPNCANSLP